mgnify:CR=1 FL=1
MKKIIVLITVLGFTVSCGSENTTEKNQAEETTMKSTQEEEKKEEEVVKRGEEVNVEDAITVAALVETLETQDSAIVTVTGEVDGVCSKKGCWMTLPISEETDLRVRFKDYAFFVPLDCSGKTATMQGVAKKEMISVDDLKHYAHDNGESEEEIAKITEPKVEYSFLANGVVIQ